MDAMPDTPPSAESTFEQQQESAIRQMANDLHRLNCSIVKAVEAGVTVELMRASRHHEDSGDWGDQMVPIVSRRS